MTQDEKIKELELKVDRLYELVEEMAYIITNHTVTVDKQINDKLEALSKKYE